MSLSRSESLTPTIEMTQLRKAYCSERGALAVAFAILNFVLLRAYGGGPIFYGEGFIERSKNTLFSLQFFTSMRPFTTDLFYKLWGSQPEHVVTGQQLLNSISWAYLAYAVSVHLRHKTAVLMNCIVFAAMAGWWNVAGWTFVMRSESLSFSLFALWLGRILKMLAHPRRKNFLWLCGVTVFFSFTRDNMPYLLLCVAFLLVVLTWPKHVQPDLRMKRFTRFYAAFVFLVLVLQSISGQQKISVENTPKPLAGRYQFCLINVIFQRVLPDKERRDWFIRHGMPINQTVDSLSNQWASSVDWAVFRLAETEQFLKWTAHKGRQIYALYLLTHPVYALTLHRAPEPWYVWNLYGYTGTRPPDLLFVFAELICRPGPWLWIANGIVSLMTLYLYVRKRVPVSWAMPGVLFLSLLTNTAFVYHADAMEVSRHNLLLAVGIFVTFFTGILFLYDRMLSKGRHLFARENPSCPAHHVA